MSEGVSDDAPRWAQWVMDVTGDTVWSHRPPPKVHFDDMDPVMLPDANRWEGPIIRMPVFTRKRRPFNLGTFPEKVEYDELQFVKARTTGDVFVWVEVNRYAQIRRRYYVREEQVRA